MNRESQPSPATLRLALTVLFGEDFVARTDEAMLRSLAETPDEWGSLVLSLWNLRSPGGVPTVEAPRATPAAAPAAPAQSPTARLQSAYAATTAAPAPPAQAAPPPVQAAPQSVQAAPAGLELFDPTAGPATGNAPTRSSRSEVRADLVQLLVEKTGYPSETFEDGLDLEVDLGIDTVKQIEVLSAVRERYELPMDTSFRMRDHATLGAVTDYLWQRLSGTGQPAFAANGAEAHPSSVPTQVPHAAPAV
jgi:hypothetical protein